MNALGLSGLAPGVLPKRWPTDWLQKSFVPFARWPDRGDIVDSVYYSELQAHFHATLCQFEVPLEVQGGFQLMDVHTHDSNLSFACTSATSTLMFKGGPDAVVIPSLAEPDQDYIDWKRPSDLQSVEGVVLQPQLELVGAPYNSNHPALVVFTDGIGFVVLQPWGRGIQCWHNFYCSIWLCAC